MAIGKMCIIWMHGLGDEGRSWRSLMDEITIPTLTQPITWKFPDAPMASVTCNDGYVMRSWFDIEDIPVTVDAKDYPEGWNQCKSDLFSEGNNVGITINNRPLCEAFICKC